MMVFDRDDFLAALTSALTKTIAAEMPRAIFTANMALQQRDIRFIGPDEDVVDLFQAGKLNEAERDFYRDRLTLELGKRQAEAVAEGKARNFHKIDPEEAKRVYGDMGITGAAIGKTEPGA